MADGHLYCGTSGFSYPKWKPDFYPEKLPAKKLLSHYASRLNSVEINYTFRRLLSASVVETWLAETPADFQFSIKAHQRITHIDRLQVSSFTPLFFRAVDVLRMQKRLGPILIQTPPNMAVDLDRLRAFLHEAPEDVPLAFEFRNKSWFNEEVYEALRYKNAALCLAESEKLVVPEVLTAGFVYFRLRKDTYTEDEVDEISRKVAELQETGRNVYVYFKHEDTPEGALSAERLLRLNAHKKTAGGAAGQAG